jgi:hypothetical protein
MKKAIMNLQLYRDEALYEKPLVIIIRSSLYDIEDRNVVIRRESQLSVYMVEQIQQHEPTRKDPTEGSREKYEKLIQIVGKGIVTKQSILKDTSQEAASMYPLKKNDRLSNKSWDVYPIQNRDPTIYRSHIIWECYIGSLRQVE